MRNREQVGATSGCFYMIVTGINIDLCPLDAFDQAERYQWDSVKYVHK